MPDTLDAGAYELPAGALISPLAQKDSAEPPSQIAAQQRQLIESALERQRQWARCFDALYDQACDSNWTERVLTQWVVALFEKQRATWEQLHPILDQLQERADSYAARPDPELLELCLATIDLALGWIKPYQRLTGRLLNLLDERRSVSSKILRARPVAGEIEHGALSREFMARYPNIRAALAE